MSQAQTNTDLMHALTTCGMGEHYDKFGFLLLFAASKFNTMRALVDVKEKDLIGIGIPTDACKSTCAHELGNQMASIPYPINFGSHVLALFWWFNCWSALIMIGPALLFKEPQAVIEKSPETKFWAKSNVQTVILPG
ncbi:hypothetical protein BT69DRAFT_1297584 [Atractiella rhizophila]|nr:hypothetical protein BT69DRAFT_1297584 [Atractiella rhizophila]